MATAAAKAEALTGSGRLIMGTMDGVVSRINRAAGRRLATMVVFPPRKAAAAAVLCDSTTSTVVGALMAVSIDSLGIRWRTVHRSVLTMPTFGQSHHRWLRITPRTWLQSIE